MGGIFPKKPTKSTEKILMVIIWQGGSWDGSEEGRKKLLIYIRKF